MTQWSRLGLIAGAGDLPLRLAAFCVAGGQGLYVSRIAGMADPALSTYPGDEHPIGALGARFRALHAAGCDAVTFAGKVQRPDLANLAVDRRGLLVLPKVATALSKGDDAIMRVMLGEFEREGFRILGPDEVMAALLAPAGTLGACHPDLRSWADVRLAAHVASALGAWDVGQGAVVCDGLVLALEAQEGTDAMLARVAALPDGLRGAPEARRGVLVKRAKPNQDRRIDLPAIGPGTLKAAASAGLAGIAVEAGATLVIDRAALIEAADALGIFVLGFAPADVDA